LLVNGAYGRRMQTMCAYLEAKVDILEFEEDEAVDVSRVQLHLQVHKHLIARDRIDLRKI